MTNTTKTLEERVRDFCRETPRLKEESGIAFHDRLLNFAREIQNSTLDACRDSIPEEKNFPNSQAFEIHEDSGFNECRREALSAIDSLRTVGGK